MSSRSRRDETEPLLGGESNNHQPANENVGSRTAGSNGSTQQITARQSLIVAGYVTNILIHASIIGFTAFVTYLSFGEGIQLFAWHPTCMLFGFFVLMTEAILCFQDTNIVTLGMNFAQRRTLHWVLQAIGSVSITVAFTVVLLNKNRIGKSHFATNHGIVGLTSVICAGISLLGGIVALYSFELRNVLRVRPVFLKLGHIIFSVCSYILAIATIVLALYSPFFKEVADEKTTIICFVLVVCVGAYVIIWPAWKAAKRVVQVVKN